MTLILILNHSKERFKVHMITNSHSITCNAFPHGPQALYATCAWLSNSTELLVVTERYTITALCRCFTVDWMPKALADTNASMYLCNIIYKEYMYYVYKLQMVKRFV